jgi:hypothetical protein
MTLLQLESHVNGLILKLPRHYGHKYWHYGHKEGYLFYSNNVRPLFDLVMTISTLHYEPNTHDLKRNETGETLQLVLKCTLDIVAEYANWAIMELLKHGKHQVTTRPTWCHNDNYSYVYWTLSPKCYRKCVKMFPTLQVIMPEEWMREVQEKLSVHLLPELSNLIISYLPSKRFE